MQAGELKYFLALTRLPNIGPARLQRVISYFPDPLTAWQADNSEYVKAGLEPKIAATLKYEKSLINPDELIDELDKHQISAVCLTDEDYPTGLKQIYDPPPVLYYLGNLNQEQTKLAVVGTRKISGYGQQVVKDLVPLICQQHITTVSGLALGVDALVHQITLASGGLTIAVLGSGLDEQNVYPSSHRYLAKKIIATGGLLISEYPPGTLPLKQHFPRRNRLISGLSQGVLVIEGSQESGSLITAQAALEQNREVMAVPGSLYSANSGGTNLLIKQGATPVTGIDDIINCLNLQIIEKNNTTAAEPSDDEEAFILKILSHTPLDLDEIIRQTRLPASLISGKLTLLEMKGLVKNIKPNTFVKTL